MVEKKHFWSLLTLMTVAMLSIGFASCSKDDDDTDDGVDTTPITLYAGDNKTIMGADTISTSNRFVDSPAPFVPSFTLVFEVSAISFLVLPFMR